MNKQEPKELERLLENFLQEEGSSITPPSSYELWSDFQARLENQTELSETKEANETVFPISEGSFKDRSYRFFQKHKAISSLAAACLLFIIIYSGFSQADTLKQLFSSMPAAVSEDEAAPLQVQQAREEQVSITTPEPEESPEEARAAGIEADEGIHSHQDDIPGEEPKDDKLDPPSMEAATVEADPENGESDRMLLEFTTYSDYFQSLKERKAHAPDEIWHLEHLPEDFSFTAGLISLSDTTILNVRQDFFSVEEQVQLSLSQTFFQQEEAASNAFEGSEELAFPVQVGPYKGYLIRHPEEFITITWLQENSIVKLSGTLAEDRFFEIIESLETL